MRILSRYFLTSYLTLFAAILVGGLLIAIIVEMLANFEEVIDARDQAGGVLVYLLIRVPSLYLRDMIPMTSFSAAFFCMGLPARWREITAIKTGGISPRRIALPVLAAALALSGVTLLVNETFLLGANREFSRIENPGRSVSFRSGSFWYHRGHIVYNVQEADRGSRQLHGVRLYRLDDRGRLLQSIRAAEVHVVDDGEWEFRNAIIRSFDPAEPTASPRVEIAEDKILDVAVAGDLALLHARSHTLSLPQLREAIEVATGQGRDALRYRAMLHARLAAPLTVLIFALLAIPIGLSVDRTRSIAVSAIFGIGAVVIYHAAWRAGELFAESGFDFAVATPWFVLATFSLIGVGLFGRIPR